MEISIKEIEKNLKSLPKEVLIQVNDYIEFLKTKYSETTVETDWADHLSDSQKESIERGVNDIKSGRIYS